MSRRSPIAVSNSSPLILFAAIRKFDLLNLIYREILIPPAVWQEVVETGTGRPAETEVRSANWIRVVSLTTTLADVAGVGRIDRGEREAIALAEQLGPGHTILLDDRAGRSFAESRGLEVIGSAGLLIRLKRRGLVPAIRPLLDELQEQGLYLSDGLYNQLLISADEVPGR